MNYKSWKKKFIFFSMDHLLNEDSILSKKFSCRNGFCKSLINVVKC